MKNEWLSIASNEEEKLLISRIFDKYRESRNKGIFTCTDFLDPFQKRLAEKILSQLSRTEYVFIGGYEGAERNILVFSPGLFCSNSDYIRCYRTEIKNSSFCKPISHRDILGALIGLGIKREKIGDIIKQDDKFYIILKSDISEYVCGNFEKAGKALLSIGEIDVKSLPSVKQQYKEETDTVPSMRLDVVAAQAFNIARGKTQDLIKSDRVFVNWEIQNSLHHKINEGDIITIRGMGRVSIATIKGISKKGRIIITFHKFI